MKKIVPAVEWKLAKFTLGIDDPLDDSATPIELTSIKDFRLEN